MYLKGYALVDCISPIFSFNGRSILFGIVSLFCNNNKNTAGGYLLNYISEDLYFNNEKHVELIAKYIYFIEQTFSNIMGKYGKGEPKPLPNPTNFIISGEFIAKPVKDDHYCTFPTYGNLISLNRIYCKNNADLNAAIEFPIGIDYPCSNSNSDNGSRRFYFYNLEDERFIHGFPLDNQDTFNIFFMELLRIIKLLHMEAQYVHLDLYPSNIYYKIDSDTNNCEIKLIDWDTVCEVGCTIAEYESRWGKVYLPINKIAELCRFEISIAKPWMDLCYLYVLYMSYDPKKPVKVEPEHTNLVSSQKKDEKTIALNDWFGSAADEIRTTSEKVQLIAEFLGSEMDHYSIETYASAKRKIISSLTSI